MAEINHRPYPTYQDRITVLNTFRGKPFHRSETPEEVARRVELRTREIVPEDLVEQILMGKFVARAIGSRNGKPVRFVSIPQPENPRLKAPHPTPTDAQIQRVADSALFGL